MILLIDDRNERVESETAWQVLTTGCSNQEDAVGQVKDMQGPSKLRSRIGLFLPQKTTDFN